MITPFNLIAEANTQAEIYHLCRLQNITCVLEYKIKNCRVDIAIIKAGKILGIVEVKNYKRERAVKSTRQIRKYRDLGYPLFVCRNYKDVPETMETIKKWIIEANPL